MCRSVSGRHKIGDKKLPKNDIKKVLTGSKKALCSFCVFFFFFF